jgi:hypothetical protein
VPYTQPFKPTDKQREAVEIMAGYGMPQDQIAWLVTDEGIDPKTSDILAPPGSR